MVKSKIFGSFKDPDGFIFSKNNTLFRQINNNYKNTYRKLIDSGLYKKLTDSQLLIPHEEVSLRYKLTDDAYKIIKPQKIPFISYSYEWCFSQLKEAALITLKIHEIALNYGFSLKDASSYNIQFIGSLPVLIDTLSFEILPKNQPWVAYKQFCRHFLAPLSLMSYKDLSLNQFLRIHLDGIPLSLTSKLLPLTSYLNLSLLIHIHLHSRSEKVLTSHSGEVKKQQLKPDSIYALIDSLKSAVSGLKIKSAVSEWSEYYAKTNYSETAFKHKRELVAKFIEIVKPKSVWDLGANVGLFSRITSTKGIPTAAIDFDPTAVEINFQKCIKEKEEYLLPLVIDLLNPSPATGFANRERLSLNERGPVDLIIVLALIHHLVVDSNIAFDMVAGYLWGLGKWLITEFIPKDDSNVQKMLELRKDIFSDYNENAFEKAFLKNFRIIKKIKIRDSGRLLYLMEKK